uniref:Protein kinase domain-containing protein n=1 Tax=Physcomitrium patens TaxID=3218 RepID=A0A7I4DI68_PHYPA
MDVQLYIYVLIIVFVLIVAGLIVVCVLACLGVRWCCLLGSPKPQKLYVPTFTPPPGFSLQRLEAIRIDPPERSSRIAAENAFLDTLPGLPPRYTYGDLFTATDGFRRILGEGGSGQVYLGLLPGGVRVAVKVLQSANQGDKEFRTEVATIGNLHHINLVRLRGFCLEGAHRLLVYEFMVNGSLDQWLFTDFIDWPTRFNVALGTAKGLAYLHHDCQERIVHLDIKPQNILLDEKFTAKVSDFGLAKLMSRSVTSQVVTQMRGTPGYLAPEWLIFSAVTDKSDVYSYGMVLLEILSGRRNVSDVDSDVEKHYFPKWAYRKIEQGCSVADIVDAKLCPMSEFDMRQADRMLRVAMACIQEDMHARPSMPLVVQMLEGVIHIPLPAPQPMQSALNTQFTRILDLNTQSALDFSSIQILSEPSSVEASITFSAPR